MKRLTAILAITGATVLAISAVPLPASAWEYYSPSSSQYQIQRSNGWSSGSYFGW